MNVPAFSVIVPALNEERCIESFLERVSRYLEATLLAARLAGRHWE